ncbi:MAG TPA: hypothetical protein VOA80_20325 [Thermoanaerobaculia bacterium]|nr:hypothetical protein [Thermoanaerobaculia bacterium]
MAEPAEPQPPVYFELHIAPLMRELDRRHMQYIREWDLLDYATVVELHGTILDQLVDKKDPMPTLKTGGPWPPEWIQLFKRWIEQKCQRLERAAGTYVATREGDDVVLRATGDAPGPGYVVWLGARVPQNGPYELALYQKPPQQAAGITQVVPFSVQERFPDSEARIVSFKVEDAKGLQTVGVT